MSDVHTCTRLPFSDFSEFLSQYILFLNFSGWNSHLYFYFCSRFFFIEYAYICFAFFFIILAFTESNNCLRHGVIRRKIPADLTRPSKCTTNADSRVQTCEISPRFHAWIGWWAGFDQIHMWLETTCMRYTISLTSPCDVWVSTTHIVTNGHVVPW